MSDLIFYAGGRARSASARSLRATFQRDERRESILLWRSGPNSQSQTLPVLTGPGGQRSGFLRIPRAIDVARFCCYL